MDGGLRHVKKMMTTRRKTMIRENWNWMKECVYNSLESFFGEEYDIEYLDDCIEDMYCNLIDNEEEE